MKSYRNSLLSAMRNAQSRASEYYTLNFRPAGLARSRIFSYTVREVNDMDKEKRKQLQKAYKNRKPQMGVIAIILM